MATGVGTSLPENPDRDASDGIEVALCGSGLVKDPLLPEVPLAAKEPLIRGELCSSAGLCVLTELFASAEPFIACELLLEATAVGAGTARSVSTRSASS